MENNILALTFFDFMLFFTQIYCRYLEILSADGQFLAHSGIFTNSREVVKMSELRLPAREIVDVESLKLWKNNSKWKYYIYATGNKHIKDQYGSCFKKDGKYLAVRKCPTNDLMSSFLEFNFLVTIIDDSPSEDINSRTPSKIKSENKTIIHKNKTAQGIEDRKSRKNHINQFIQSIYNTIANIVVGISPTIDNKVYVVSADTKKVESRNETLSNDTKKTSGTKTPQNEKDNSSEIDNKSAAREDVVMYAGFATAVESGPKLVPGISSDKEADKQEKEASKQDTAKNDNAGKEDKGKNDISYKQKKGKSDNADKKEQNANTDVQDKGTPVDNGKQKKGKEADKNIKNAAADSRDNEADKRRKTADISKQDKDVNGSNKNDQVKEDNEKSNKSDASKQGKGTEEDKKTKKSDTSQKETSKEDNKKTKNADTSQKENSKRADKKDKNTDVGKQENDKKADTKKNDVELVQHNGFMSEVSKVTTHKGILNSLVETLYRAPISYIKDHLIKPHPIAVSALSSRRNNSNEDDDGYDDYHTLRISKHKNDNRNRKKRNPPSIDAIEDKILEDLYDKLEEKKRIRDNYKDTASKNPNNDEKSAKIQCKMLQEIMKSRKVLCKIQNKIDNEGKNPNSRRDRFSSRYEPSDNEDMDNNSTKCPLKRFTLTKDQINSLSQRESDDTSNTDNFLGDLGNRIA